ncbi:NAD(P)-binding domain-containing protein [Neomicrococcus lactis]|uniref:NAD(P)-binding domain-containing protein n=1 Tax=Neomicrococcus lactis TaxID=732241 RepID=UPI002301F3FF|nr:NAD(P)-binding domain-containing protein [Neomicrococcus lactis]
MESQSLNEPVRFATVIVIGAGQAGLSAGYHLKKRGFVSALVPQTNAILNDAVQHSERNFVMFDAGTRPGGAWQHRWDSLLMDTVNGIFDLPGYPKPPVDPQTPSNQAVPAYFEAFEKEFQLPIERPVKVLNVTREGDSPEAEFTVETSHGTWRTQAIINATGTWDNPIRPSVPGAESFTGEQFHTREYVSAEHFRGKRVAIVGAGISAVEHLAEVSAMTTTLWYVRRPPNFRTGKFESEFAGRETIAKVVADVEEGKPTGSVVSYTGLSLQNRYAKQAQANGALNWRLMFMAIEPCGVREADGTFTRVDAIIWATGFKPSLKHLEPLQLTNDHGGIQLDGTHPVNEPLIHLIGFGPSSSTVGANRAGRMAVATVVRELKHRNSVQPATQDSTPSPERSLDRTARL